jgi:Uncharacterized conserved protein
MKIGIDIDGVLNDHDSFCINYGTKYCHEIGKYELTNLDVFDTTEMFMWPDETAHNFWDKYRRIILSEMPTKIFAKEVIKKLKDEGNDIYIITARKNYDPWDSKELQPIVEKETIKWLNKNDIIYDKIYFDIENKGTFCKENNIEIMIDDDPKNVRKLIGNTNPIIFDTPYNRQEEFSDITRSYSWYDIYNKINKL